MAPVTSSLAFGPPTRVQAPGRAPFGFAAKQIVSRCWFTGTWYYTETQVRRRYPNITTSLYRRGSWRVILVTAVPLNGQAKWSATPVEKHQRQIKTCRSLHDDSLSGSDPVVATSKSIG